MEEEKKEEEKKEEEETDDNPSIDLMLFNQATTLSATNENILCQATGGGAWPGGRGGRASPVSEVTWIL